MAYQIEKKVNKFYNTVTLKLKPYKLVDNYDLQLSHDSSPNGDIIKLTFGHTLGDFEDYTHLQNGIIIIRLNDLENITLHFQGDAKERSIDTPGPGGIWTFRDEYNYVILDKETLEKISYAHTVAVRAEWASEIHEFNEQVCGNFNEYCKTLYVELYGTNVDGTANDTFTGNGMNYANTNSNLNNPDASNAPRQSNEGNNGSPQNAGCGTIMAVIIIIIPLFLLL